MDADADSSNVNDRSGGADLNAGADLNIGGDVVGRDKVTEVHGDQVSGDKTTSIDTSGGASISGDVSVSGGKFAGHDNIDAETYINNATIVNDRTNRVWLYVLAGIVGLIVVVIGIIASRPATAPATEVKVILPTDAPTATPRPSTPTPTLTPIPTETPIFRSNARYRVAIAKMNDQNATKKYAIEPRLEADLRRALREAGLAQDVDVRVVSQPAIESESAALDFASSTRSDIVVWGIYDDSAIRLSVLLGPQNITANAANTVLSTSDLPLANSSAPTGTETISYYITGTLPSDAKFLSLYVIGHLDYLANRFDDGHRAFDAATKELPGTVRIENEALVHFFQARALPTDTYSNTETIACEYAQAIQLDPTMFEAYNNLGVLLDTNPNGLSTFPSEKVLDCFTAAGLASSQASDQTYKVSPSDLFAQALKIKPDLGVAHANLAILDWNQHLVTNTSPEDRSQYESWSQILLTQREQARREFEAALKIDPTLGVAHIALGNMAAWDGDYLKATDHYSAALKLNPKSPEVMLNLGQSLLLSGHSVEAESAFQQALQIDPNNIAAQLEAHLALGDLYRQQGKLDQAYAEFAKAERSFCQEPCGLISDSHQTFNLGLIANDIQAGKWISASQRFDNLIGYTSSITEARSENPVAWLIGRNTGVSLPATFVITTDITHSVFWSWTQSDLQTLISHDLVTDCKGRSPSPGTCVYDQTTLLNTFLPVISSRIHQRLFYIGSPLSVLGMACPYLYTFDTQQNNWQFDTTILYKLAGPQAKATQARRLTRFAGQLLIREVEPEMSYIDSLEVRLITADGREITLKPDSALLSAVDNEYLILHQGDQQVLTFKVPEGALPAREASVVATGYYIPLHR